MARAMPWRIVAVMATLLGAGLLPVPETDAAGLRPVTAWITVGSVRPAVGCTVDVAVEVREAGAPVAQTEVSIALFVDDELVSIDQGVTDGDGLAFLTFDTGGAYDGASGWLDVNVAGGYVGGLSIIPTADGACSGDGRMIETSADVPAVLADVSETVSEAPAFPTYAQQRTLSCEYAALQIATTAWGNPISEYAFDDIVGLSPNPHWGYRGYIGGEWGNTTDYGVYAEPLSWALDAFGYYGEVFYAVGDSSALTARLDDGIPTLVWLALWGDLSHVEETDGVPYTLVPGMHVVVAYAYDEGGVYVSDPGNGTLRYVPWGDFMDQWNVLDGMALAVSPY